MIFYFFKELVENGIVEELPASNQSIINQPPAAQPNLQQSPIDNNGMQQQTVQPVQPVQPAQPIQQIDVFGNPTQSTNTAAVNNNVQVQAVPSAFANNAPMPITDNVQPPNPQPI